MSDMLPFPPFEERKAERPVSDALARERALDTRVSCIVEAPAGSGKTGLLVQRYLKLLGDPGVEHPEEVLAITFTNKATAELQERVLRELHAAQRGALEDDAQAFERATRALAIGAMARSTSRGWGLLERPQQMNIRSIDSVCAEIANSMPLLSGGGGPRKPLAKAQALYRLAARRTMLQLGGGDKALHDALRTVLLHRDGNLADCEALLADMLESREQWGELVPLDRGELGEETLDREVRLKLERSLESIVCAGLSRALRAMPQGVLEELTSLAARLGVEPGYKSAVSPIAVCAGRNDPPEAAADHLDHWVALIWLVLRKSGDWRKRYGSRDVDFALPKADAERLTQLVQDIQSEGLREALKSVLSLPPAKYPEEQWAVAKALFHVLRHALAELRLLFAEQEECDFTEFALAARAALRADEGSSDAALSAGGRLRHLLVDEMQDTSSGQYELLELLTRSWDGQTQTLFLVGDPKQSIYLFRQARVERFLRTMQERRLGEIVLEPFRLTANFRSQEALVRDFNSCFDRMFLVPGDPALAGAEAVDVPFVEASAAREETFERGVNWHPSLSSDEGTSADRAAEAKEIRRLIEERLAMPLPAGRSKPWSVAVLARARRHLDAITAEFQRDEGSGPLRYRAVDLDALHELPEVMDALALTRALLHPADRVAWLAVLHAPWCGLGLADLLRLTGEGDETSAEATVAELVRERAMLLSDEGQRLLARAWPVLESATSSLGRTTLAVHVERTWRSLGGDAALSAAQRANVMHYLASLREVERDGGRADLSVLSARLKDLYAEPTSSAAVDGKLPVELMTIHKAKGLEWDFVFVPGLERGGGQGKRILLNWLEFDGASTDGEQASVVLAPIWQKGEDTDKLSQWLNRMRSKREQAELKRVFYVATTRAKEKVHLFGSLQVKKRGDGLRPPRVGSLLRACWPAAASQFQTLVPSGQVMLSLDWAEEEFEDEGLAMAASADTTPVRDMRPPMIQRLPLEFDPGERFRFAKAHRLPYAEATALRRVAAFERPEGSFAVRAFGNVVHRYLHVIATRLGEGATAETLLSELPAWDARLAASLRGEGLPPSLVAREAQRVARSLSTALADAVGRWILSPHAAAASEKMLTVGMEETRSLRVDRTFLAGHEPLAPGDGCIWIVDFKTTDVGSHSLAEFEERERAKYGAQLEAYATLRRSMPDGNLPIRLGLYYPAAPLLIHWLSGDNSGTSLH